MKKGSSDGSMKNEMAVSDTDYTASLEENQDVIKSSSRDGKYVIVADQSQGKYNVELFSGDEKNKLKTYSIVGGNYSFLWSPDNRKVCVSYSGGIWSDFSIIDVSTQALMEHPQLFDKLEVDYELNANRPDPYLKPIEWSPDSSRILVSYYWKDTNYTTQNGVFVYNIDTKEVSDLIENEPVEGDHGVAKKPENFKW
jgi:Tol biopolymer transport system component